MWPHSTTKKEAQLAVPYLNDFAYTDLQLDYR